ncbi:MAG: YbjN domain-containing protein [Cyanobacteria bacterium SBLK]|nr:YbjN domain-containing protein [Cyanobacteria bacterium SBLK]
MFISDSIELDRPIALRTSEGQLLTVQLKQVALDRLDKMLKRCTMTFSTSARVYKNIEAKKLLGLDGETGEDFLPKGLEDDEEVEIETALKRELVTRLLQEARDRFPDDENTVAALVARYLITLEQSLNETPFLNTENWYAIFVQQDISVPDDMEIALVMKRGGKTEWGYYFERQEEREDIEEEGSGEIFLIASSFFQEEGLNAHIDEEDEIIALSIPGRPGTWNCYCEIDEEQRLCLIYSIFPLKARPKQYGAIAELIARINYNTSIGNFDLSYETGEIRFRTSIDLEGDRFSKALMKQLFVSNIFKLEQYYNSILMVLMEEATPEEAIDNPEFSLT